MVRTKTPCVMYRRCDVRDTSQIQRCNARDNSMCRMALAQCRAMPQVLRWQPSHGNRARLSRQPCGTRPAYGSDDQRRCH